MPDPAPPGPPPPARAPAVTRKKVPLSWIWLVPIVAAIAGFVLVTRTWFDAGPTITITFQTAEGLEAGKTQVRYKDVVIGTVKNIRLNEDRSKVIVTADITKDAASLAQEGSRFWVVRPRLGIGGVSGLTTLLSGAYIGVDAPPAPEQGQESREPVEKTDFVGLEEPPEVAHDRPGKRFTLRADSLGSLDVGSPVYYRRINVGQVIGYQLDEAGRRVNVQIFIDAPNDRFVTEATRFWNASGFDIALNADGLKVRTQSMLSVAIGGIAFEQDPAVSAKPAGPDSAFTLYENESTARATPDGDPFPIRMRFDQSIRGLAVGAPIDFNGIVLGQVEAITMDFDTKTKRFFAVVESNLYPQRLGAVFERVREFDRIQSQAATGAQDTPEPGGRLLKSMIEHGLRAQLRSANLLTGQLYVALDVFRDAPPVKFEVSIPADIPTQPGNLDQLQQQVTNIVNRIDKIPFDKIGADLATTLESATRLMNKLDKQVAPEAQAVLRQANKSLASISSLLAPDAGLPVNAARAMEELSRAARSLRALADYLQANPEALVRGRGKDPIPGYPPGRN